MDIIKRLRKCESMLMQDLCLEGADEIERLRAEVLEQCRLNAMGSEREARLMTQLAERDDEISRIGHQLHQMAVDLAGAQAREQVLREAIVAVLCDHDLEPCFVGSSGDHQVIRDALLLTSTDHTALDALLKAERAKERERCAKVLRKEAEDYALEYGHDDMGGLSFGTGAHAEYKMDRYNDLLEMADKLLALRDEK